MEWKRIETAPKDGTEVLVYGLLKDGSGHFITVCPFRGVRWTIEWLHNCFPPTHWMPLPDPPQ